MFGDDEQAALRQKIVQIGNPSGDGILHRQDAVFGLALAHGVEHVFECQAGKGGMAGKDRPGRQIRIRPANALKCDDAWFHTLRCR